MEQTRSTLCKGSTKVCMETSIDRSSSDRLRDRIVFCDHPSSLVNQ